MVVGVVVGVVVVVFVVVVVVVGVVDGGGVGGVVVVVVVVVATLVVLSAEPILPVNTVSCSWIVSKASAILALASSNVSSRDLRDSNSSVEQLIEGAPVIWSERTGMWGLEGKLRANSVSRRATMTTSEQSETSLSDLPVLLELIKT